MKINHYIIKFIYALIIIIATKTASAAEPHSFDCGGEKYQASVTIFLAEDAKNNRAEIKLPHGEFSATASAISGNYENLLHKIQIINNHQQTTLIVDQEEFFCKHHFTDQEIATAALNHQKLSVFTHNGGNGTILNDHKGQSLGGRLRMGPGTNFRILGSLASGANITLTANTGLGLNGYNWFEIKHLHDVAYQWGGVICSKKIQIDDIYTQCGKKPVKLIKPLEPINQTPLTKPSNTNDNPIKQPVRPPKITKVSSIPTPKPAPKKPTPAKAPVEFKKWVAFSAGKFGHFGWADASKQKTAEEKALKNCNHSSCILTDYSEAKCFAYAKTSKNSYWFAAGRNLKFAQNLSLAYCKNVGSGCHLVFSHCRP